MSLLHLKSGEAIVIRDATLSDIPSMASMASRAYFDTPSSLSAFLSPHRKQHPKDFERGFRHRIEARFVNPRTQSIVAVLASTPSHPIAYAQFTRLGDNPIAQRQISSRDTYPLRILSWYYWAQHHIADHFWPDKSADPKALQEFVAWGLEDDEKYWSAPERANRWHAQSVVVAPEWQGKGVGRLLMRPILDRARDEGVVVGLEASQEGERLYSALGFRVLGRFCKTPQGTGGGGFMLWEPTSMIS